MKINLLLIFLASICLNIMNLNASECKSENNISSRYSSARSSRASSNSEDTCALFRNLSACEAKENTSSFLLGYFMYHDNQRTIADQKATIDQLQQTLTGKNTHIEKAQAAIPTFKDKLLFGGVCAFAGTALGICLCKTDFKNSMPNIKSSLSSFFYSFKGSPVKA